MNRNTEAFVYFVLIVFTLFAATFWNLPLLGLDHKRGAAIERVFDRKSTR